MKKKINIVPAQLSSWVYELVKIQKSSEVKACCVVYSKSVAGPRWDLLLLPCCAIQPRLQTETGGGRWGVEVAPGVAAMPDLTLKQFPGSSSAPVLGILQKRLFLLFVAVQINKLPTSKSVVTTTVFITNSLSNNFSWNLRNPEPKVRKLVGFHFMFSLMKYSRRPSQWAVATFCIEHQSIVPTTYLNAYRAYSWTLPNNSKHCCVKLGAECEVDTLHEWDQARRCCHSRSGGRAKHEQTGFSLTHDLIKPTTRHFIVNHYFTYLGCGRKGCGSSGNYVQDSRMG